MHAYLLHCRFQSTCRRRLRAHVRQTRAANHAHQSHFPFPASVPSLLQVKYPDGGFVSTYVKYMPPGIMMIIVFALLIPGFWFMAVHTNRTRLDVSGQLAAMLPVWVMLPCCLSC